MVTVKRAVLRREIGKRGTVAEFAREIDTTPSYMGMILTGSRRPGPQLRRRILKELRMTFDELFIWDEESVPA